MTTEIAPLTMDDLDAIAARASKELGFPMEVTHTGGNIWLVIGRVPDSLLEVCIGDGDFDTRYRWSVNRLDEAGDYIDNLATDDTLTLRKALCGIRLAIALEAATTLGFDTFAPVRPPKDLVELTAWYAFMANHSDIPHCDDSAADISWASADLVALFNHPRYRHQNRRRYDRARRAAYTLHPDPCRLAMSIDLV